MAFTAYDKVHHTQYDLYQQYAEVGSLGAEAERIARKIHGFRQKDDAVDVLFHLLSEVKHNTTVQGRHGLVDLVPWEFNVYAVVSASGEGYDVYLTDEDQFFISSVAGVAEEDVVAEGTRLMREWRAERK